MKVFVTGAGGFIGSRLVSHLARLGHDVRGHVRSEKGDITAGSIPLNTDAVVNSAGRLGGGGVQSSEMENSNTALPRILADFCSQRGAHLVHLSTPGVAGLKPDVPEDAEYDPWGEYERSKTAGERAVLEHGSLDPASLTVLRPDFVYGPGDAHKLPFFRQVRRGWMPLVGRNGARIRPTYCQDVCRAVEASLPGGMLSGGLFNIAGPEVLTVREFAEAAAAAMESRIRLIPLPSMLFRLALLLGPLCPAPLSKSRLKLFGTDHYVSTRKAESTGFAPEWTIAKGVFETVSWYRGRGLL